MNMSHDIDMSQEKKAVEDQINDFNMREGQRSGSAIDNNTYVGQLVEKERLETKDKKRRNNEEMAKFVFTNFDDLKDFFEDKVDEYQKWKKIVS
jgi:hypothetical protein